MAVEERLESALWCICRHRKCLCLHSGLSVFSPVTLMIRMTAKKITASGVEIGVAMEADSERGWRSRNHGGAMRVMVGSGCQR